MKVIVHLGFQKTRFEDLIHYYFTFVFVKDRKKIADQVGNKYQVCYFILFFGK